ncbi:MAG: ComF family protein [Bacteroidetes bacterium]|nr:MAG: ComF family protein [Bacteroidota bacterium]
MKIINNLIEIFYPKICLACERRLLDHERVLCSYCELNLPKTNFHNRESNPVEILFWGRCRIDSASAYYRYIKQGNVQNLIHNFKYKGYQEIGLYIGEIYGKQLMASERYKTVDLIIPVPLHNKKLKIRGFNQSEVFAHGLSRSMKAITDSTILIRNIHTSTQTKKSRWDRHKNVSSIFSIKDPELLKGKHIMIVDDVITTGSTIESCVNTLTEIEDIKISVIAIASAAH